MKVPLVAKAQVRMLAEGVVDAAPPASAVPDDLMPSTMFTDDGYGARSPSLAVSVGVTFGSLAQKFR